MTRLAVAVRLLTIQRALVRHGLDEFVRATHLYRPLRLLQLLSPWTWFARRRGGSRGQRLREALEELGPIFIKFGQALSTRRDLLPRDIADELARLQDSVPPFPGEEARARIESALGQPVGSLFASFETEALAAASIAQVHAATLADGREVVVKVLRPGMREVIRRDLDVLHQLARLAHRYWQPATRLRPSEVVTEYEKTILDELDLMREAANAAQLRRNFEGSDLLHVPEVYWDLCRRDVMVMERIRGVPISEVSRLREAGTDIRKLSENGVTIFFTQVFRHNFFHADMHPGNVFVDITDPANPRYAAVDFGIIGELEPRDQYYLAANFLAFFDRDWQRIAELHLESGWIPSSARLSELTAAVRTVCEPIFNKPLGEISFAMVLLRLFEVARRFEMPVQPQLILLQKTLLNIEGLGRELYPELDLMKTARPVLREWMDERVGPRGLLRSLRRHWPDLAESLKMLPVVAQRAGRRAYEEEWELPIRERGAAEQRTQLETLTRRRDTLWVAGTLFLGGVLWLGLEADPRWAGWVLAVGGFAPMAARLLRSRD
ncbi:MAG: ubiquinone biosynthesis regulatory protein kinase UbiB [Steroidobacteraceae bacterium]